MTEALPWLGLALAVVGQVGALSFWGGRISHRLEAVERRLELLELARRAA